MGSLHVVNVQGLALLLLVCAICYTGGEHHARIALSPEVHEVVKFVNESYIVTCNPRLDIKLVWLNSRGELVTERKGRVHVEYIAGGLSLVFERIALADKGNWSCAWIDNKDIRSTFKMTIKQEIHFVDTPPLQIAQEHKGTLIRCKADGDPVPKISWYFNGISLNVTSKKYNATGAGLRLRNVSLSDAGNYVCKGYQISATLVKSKEQLIRLKVQHKPYFMDTTETVFALINGTATISCNVIAEPPANFSWYRDGTRLSTLDGYDLDIRQSSITVLIANASLFGVYTCKAVNSIGAVERVFTLRPGLKPDTPSLSLLNPNPNSIAGTEYANDVSAAVAAVDSDTFAIYLNVSLPPEHQPVNVTEMDATGFRVQYISHDNYTQSNRTWTHAEYVDYDYRKDGGPYVLPELVSNRIYLVRAATKNVAGFSDFSEPPLEVNLSALQLGQTSGGGGGRRGECLTFTRWSFCGFLYLLVVFHALLVGGGGIRQMLTNENIVSRQHTVTLATNF